MTQPRPFHTAFGGQLPRPAQARERVVCAPNIIVSVCDSRRSSGNVFVALSRSQHNSARMLFTCCANPPAEHSKRDIERDPHEQTDSKWLRTSATVTLNSNPACLPIFACPAIMRFAGRRTAAARRALANCFRERRRHTRFIVHLKNVSSLGYTQEAKRQRENSRSGKLSTCPRVPF